VTWLLLMICSGITAVGVVLAFTTAVHAKYSRIILLQHYGAQCATRVAHTRGGSIKH